MSLFLKLLFSYIAVTIISLFFNKGLFAILLIFLGPCCLLFFIIGELYDSFKNKD